MPLDDAPEIRLRDRIFQGLFHLFGREPKTFSLLHRLLLTASQMVGWDGTKSTLVKTDKHGRLDLAPIVVGVTAPVGAGILLCDDLEGAFNWIVSGTGTDYIAERRVEAAFHGDYGLFMRPRETGAAAGDHVEAYHHLAMSSTPFAAASLRFNFYETVRTRYLDFFFQIWDETGRYIAKVRWDESADLWKYLDANNDYQPIPGLLRVPDPNRWYTIELEVDTLGHLYRRLRVMAQEIDLSSIAIRQEEAGVFRFGVSFYIVLWSDTVIRPRLYIDDVLVREVA